MGGVGERRGGRGRKGACYKLEGILHFKIGLS